ncbi:nuclear factor of activated T-cells 5-like isoform X4 [Mya arenaria]|uniref:nuclear factor of activated T-cells 5-like isoform X4 n=1 Tax=Mya arenaria TaxID=6604 RepID=UPI0022DF4493|nr:nuclear factor of activated T-cells 5-like isoform X4 [Mya arenaria]
MLIPHRQPIAMEVIFMERACGGDLHDVQPFDPDTEMSEETGIQLLNGETTVSKSCNGETNQPINGHHLPNSGPSFDFIKNVSAAELLKTIATATSQANQLITAHNSGMKNHPLPLGLDLNSMINDAKSSSLKSPTLSQHNFKDQDGGVLSFNGLSQGLSMNNGLSHGLTVNVNSGNEPVIISDGDRRQSDSAFSPNLLPFDGQIPTGQMPQIPHNGVSSPEYPTSSTGSPYTDPNLSPFDSGVNFMETEHGVPLPLNPSNGLSFPADTATQSSLINGTDRLCIDSIQPIDNVDSELKPKQELTDLDFENKAGKVPRMPQDSDASTASTSMLPSVDCVFNPDEAQQEVPNEFIFTKFGQEGDDPNLGSVYPFRSEGSEVLNSESPALPSVVSPSPFKTPTNVFQKKRGELRRQKEPILCQHFPASKHGCELRILEQPEDQHRARYLTEGSRGAVKSKNGNGHPVVKLFGYSGEATLQVFIGNDNGKVRPHGFYQACKVCGKNSTQCVDRDIDGTTVIEITLCPSNDMTATIDCVGILKLRNADVEQRIGLSKAKKKSTKARMIFRVTFQKPCGSPQVLQLPSHTILCTQPIGQPEICKMSLKESFMSGGDELFIIGKNFLRGTRVFFQQMVDDQDDPLWEREGEIDKDFFQTTHLIVVVPSYDGDTSTLAKANFQVVVHSGGKISESQPFAYKSDDPDIKQDMDMTVEDNGRKRNYPFVAPEALELNHQIQRSSSGSDSMFKLPPSVISEVMDQTTSYSAMDQSPSNQPEASNQSIVQSKSDGSFHSSDSSRRESFSMNQISDDTLSEVQSHFNEGEGEVQWEPMGSQPLTIPGSMYELGGSSHTSLATVHHPPAAFQSLVSSLQNSIMSVQSSSQPAGQGHNLPASGINMPTSLAQLPQFLQLIASHGLSQSQQDKIQQQLQNNAGQQQPSGHVNLNQELIQSVLQQHLSQKTNLQNGRIQTSQQQQQQQQQHLLVTSPPQQHGMSPSPSQQYQQPMDNICAPQHQQNQPSQQQFVSPSQDAQVHSSQPHTPLQFPPPSPTMAPASPYTSVASPHTPQVSSMVHLGSPMVNHTDLAESPSPAMVQSPMPASPYLPSQQPTGAQPPAVQVDQSMAQPQLFLQGMTQSQTLSTVTGALNMQAAGFPGTTVAASSAQSTPTAPQIIICNSSPQGMPGTQGQFGGGAPSIVIVPGQGGSNNNMESLLRSILGSMMPQQQTQPAEPPTQTPMNE